MTTTIFKLTNDQAKAITKMKEFCAYPEHQFFRLTGYAGTGKSYLICQLIKWLQNNNYKVIAASPTNKAAKNLESMASEAGIALNVTTVAKLLGQQAVLNEQTGKEEFISQGNEAIDTYDVIIIDEFSMVNIDNFVDIKIEVEDSNKTKVIFVGDSAQLPPVNENEPIVASHPDITCHANLSTVVRYDGELAKVAAEIRSDRSISQTIYPFITTSDRTIVCLDRYEWLQKAVSLFKSDEFRVNPNYVRFLVWRNKQADILNAYVRNSLWGEDVSAYVPGDRLIAKLPVFRSGSEYTATGKRKKKNKWQIIISIAEFFKEYISKRGMTCKFNESDYLQASIRLNDMVSVTQEEETEQNQEGLTILLVKLYAEWMIAAKQGSSTEESPQSVPDLIILYLNELNQNLEEEDKLEKAKVHQISQIVAWKCIESDLKSGKAETEEVIQALENLESGQEEARTKAKQYLNYLVKKLFLVRKNELDEKTLRFTLDPIAEYLAALYIVQEEGRWSQFLNKMGNELKAPEQSLGFLRAVRDCCLAQEAKKAQEQECFTPDFKELLPCFEGLIYSDITREIAIRLEAFKVLKQFWADYNHIPIVTTNGDGGGTISLNEPPATDKIDLGNDVILEMVSIPGGTFMMGTEDEEIERLVEKFKWEGLRREKPQHEITVQPFFMGKYPITQAQWREIASLPKVERYLAPDPSYFKGDNLPVEQVFWDDAEEFCHRLSKQTGQEYRLPSEAEWEYACRAGTTTPFHFGETITDKLANYRATNIYANEPKGEYRQETTPVGSFPPNAFGLYDMHGLLWEWCEDDWHENYQGAPEDGTAWLSGMGNVKVLRGGSWSLNPVGCRSAYRNYLSRVNRLNAVGFRVVCVVPRTT